MFTKWDQLEALHKRLEDQVSSGNVTSKDRAEVQRNLSAVSDILRVHQARANTRSSKEIEKQAPQEPDLELASLFSQEIQDLKSE